MPTKQDRCYTCGHARRHHYGGNECTRRVHRSKTAGGSKYGWGYCRCGKFVENAAEYDSLYLRRE